MYKVYVRVDGGRNITAVSSNAFLLDTTGWAQVDEGDGDRYHHAQGNYLHAPLMDEHGRYRYKLVEGAVVERTPEDLTADALPVPIPTLEERTNALETATQQQAATLDEVVTILEAIV